eukprot:6180163-Pleurochrysis_carterae.AAC.1
MALVHSRVRRLVYAVAAADGALGSRYRIHAQKGLNHHYLVVANLLKDEAAGLIDGAPRACAA